MATLSSHKIYGPKGAGALVATREARKRLAAVVHGGGQERDLRSETPNVPAIVCFDKALEIDPKNSFAHHGKSESLLKLVRKQEVAECMKLADKFGVTL